MDALSEAVACLWIPDVDGPVTRCDVPCAWRVQHLKDRLAVAKIGPAEWVLVSVAVIHRPDLHRLVSTPRRNATLRVKHRDRTNPTRVALVCARIVEFVSGWVRRVRPSVRLLSVRE